MTVRKTTRELVVPVAPTQVYRVVVRTPAGFRVRGGLEFRTALAALSAVRDEVEATARHPVDVVIDWDGVEDDWIPPTTGTSLG